MTRKSVWMMALVIGFVVLGNVVPLSAMGKKEGLIKIGNGFGSEITALQISPAKAKYPGNENCMSFQDIRIKDGATFVLVLPDQMKNIDTFDVELISDGKRYVSPRRGVTINLKSSKIPTLELSRNGKDSTWGHIGAAAGAVGGLGAIAAAAAALYTGAIVIGQAAGTTALVPALGVSVVAAIPVALVAGGYFIGKALAPRGMDIQVYYL
jgi:hypothetical protein